MSFSRRDTLALGAGAVALTTLPLRVGAAVTAEEVMNAFTGGADVGEGGVTLTAPEIAENGNTVPVSVESAGATAIAIIATGNPNPEVCTFNFGELTGGASASTRIRLAGTQDVVAVARMADGSYKKASQTVKVTIGGCGG